MDLFSIIKSRRSIRSFKKGKEISKDIIEKVLEAGRWAPTAGNVQPWQFFVILKQDIKDALAEAAYEQDFIGGASFIIVVCTSQNEASMSYGKRGADLYCIQDTAAAIQNMLLMIHSLGLGSCWVGAFSEEETSRILDIPKELRPVAILPVGYPDESPNAPERKSLDSIVEWF